MIASESVSRTARVFFLLLDRLDLGFVVACPCAPAGEHVVDWDPDEFAAGP